MQQLFHLLQIPITPSLSSWLGGCDSLGFCVLVNDPQQGRGIREVVWFLVISYKDSNQSSTFGIGMAPDFLIHQDISLGDVH